MWFHTFLVEAGKDVVSVVREEPSVVEEDGEQLGHCGTAHRLVVVVFVDLGGGEGWTKNTKSHKVASTQDYNPHA